MGGCVTVCVWPNVCVYAQVFKQILPSTTSQIQNHMWWWETVNCIIANKYLVCCVMLQDEVTSHLNWNDCMKNKACWLYPVCIARSHRHKKRLTILARKRLYVTCSVLHQHQNLQTVRYKKSLLKCTLISVNVLFFVFYMKHG